MKTHPNDVYGSQLHDERNTTAAGFTTSTLLQTQSPKEGDPQEADIEALDQ